jgi:hypothetical protein
MARGKRYVSVDRQSKGGVNFSRSDTTVSGSGGKDWKDRPGRVIRQCIGSQQASRMRRRPSFISMRLKVYWMGLVRGLSLVSRTKTASSFARSVLLALRLIEWIAPGGSDQLSPAR